MRGLLIANCTLEYEDEMGFGGLSLTFRMHVSKSPRYGGLFEGKTFS